MKTVRGLNEQIGAAVGKEPMNDNWLPVYAACFGLGLLLMCGALMITIAKSSEGRSVNGFMMLREAGTKAVFFIPLCTLLPGIVMALYNGADQMGEVMMKGAWESFQRAQSEIETTLEGSVMLGLVFTSPILLLLLVLGIIVFGVMLLLELTIAHYALYVMTCLAPLAAGLSVHPRFKGIATKMFSGMVGVMLVKPALWLAMWIGWDVVYQESDRTDGLAVLTMYLVVLFVSCSVPILTATILPKLLGNDGLEGTSQNVLSRVSRAGNSAERRVNQARGFGRGFGSKTGAAQKGAAGANRLGPTASTKAGGSAAKAGSVTGGAGGASRASAAAGPAGMAVAAGVQATAAGHQALTGAIAGRTSGEVDAGGKPDGVSDAVDVGGPASGGGAKTMASVGGSTSSEVGAAATSRPQGVADAATAGTSATTTAGAVAAAGTVSGAATATGQTTGTTDKPEGDSSAGKATESASAGAVTSSAVSAAGKRVEGTGATPAGTSQAPSRPTGTAASTRPETPNPGRPDVSGGSGAPSPAPAGTSKGPDFRYPDSRPAREGSSVMPPAPKQQPPKPPWPGPTPPPPAPTEEQT